MAVCNQKRQIPGIELQQNGISTGIVFKGQIMATDKAHPGN